jgi:ATP-dependent helicase/nuclease subunit B
MAERADRKPRLYTIPPSAPFLMALAKAVLNGDLPVPGGPPPDPLALAAMTVYLPTRRAARALAQAFLDASGGQALLLPRIKTLGDPDEEALLFGVADDENLAGAGAPAISPLQRRLILMRLILAWRQSLVGSGGLTGPSAPIQPPMTPGQASSLAADLARFMDFVETEEADLAGLADLVPEELSGYWAGTLDFLKIVTEQWPAVLAERGLVSPVARRTRLMGLEAERLAQSPQPVIAAGSTGTVPATARLLNTIASLPNGAVVLPGLDLSLDEESWHSLAAHPEHPQAGMAELLRRLQVTRAEVAVLAGSEPSAARAARCDLMSEALRPAESTERWHALAPERARLVSGVDGIGVMTAASPQDEAEIVALLLRFAAERPDQTAALVTPDRALARRVAARLKQFGLEIDDSAGVPVGRTVPGAFLDLILQAAESNFAPVQTMALLKHPLTRLKRHAGEIRKAARSLEQAAFRDIYVGQGLEGIAAALASGTTPFSRDRPKPGGPGLEAARRLLADLEAAFAPLLALKASGCEPTAAAFAQAHAAVAEELATDETGANEALWTGEAGEAFSLLFERLIADGASLTMNFADYGPFYRSLLSGEVVRPRRSAHPRLAILGPLEARMLRPDVVILGGLNEGVWPRPPDSSPWLNRAMQAALGLPPPERRIGLSAHDFAQSLGADKVYLTRSLKVNGVPTVPSRFVQRLDALAKALDLTDALRPARPWADWAKTRDAVAEFDPAKPPSFCPPVAARPRKLSVSRIEKWIANPYDIFARNILKLEPLVPLGQEPNQALRGQVVHAALSDFAKLYPAALPDDIGAALISVADGYFRRLGGAPRIEAFWRPAFENFAAWFAATEPARRAGIGALHTEVSGRLDLPDCDFTLTARADRIDLDADGQLAIYDYKTGSVPADADVNASRAPQLSLEAAIAGAGGFENVPAAAIKRLVYISATGRGDGGVETVAGNTEPESQARAALEALSRLVEKFDDSDTPYRALRRAKFSYRYDDYAQLARIEEWSIAEDGGGEA